MNYRATLIPINEYSTLIDDAGASAAYLIRGTDKALLIDTLNGVEDLAEIVRTVTDLPVIVVNTHGHIDHIGCNHFFPEAYLHRGDWDLYGRHLEMLRQSLKGNKAAVIPDGTECRIKPIEPGEVIDLGGRKLEVIHIPGHTLGSIALLDRDARLLYTGDAINRGQMWMQLDDSTTLTEYYNSLTALDRFRPEFDGLFGGHARGAATPTSFIDKMKHGIEEILSGNREADGKCQWFGGMADSHTIEDDSILLYNRKRIG